ncbi:MAG: bromoperoxidase, partial [Candidatus Electrothrix sp. AX5]|nr:bromoperoxidase [Candidatus Electrothrix sp. AX5]
MNNDRRQEALRVRIEAAKLAAGRVHPRHEANGDEQKFRRTVDKHGQKVNEPSYLASFTKGLPHNKDTGLVEDSEDFQQLIKGIDSGDPRDFEDTRLGPKGEESSPEWESPKNQGAKVRAWESQGAGNTFDLEGPDAQAVTMPPAPALGSDELTAEMAEVYAQALLRDVPFTKIVDGSGDKVEKVVEALNELNWFDKKCDLTPAERSRKRNKFIKEDGKYQKLFRGITPGDDIGPYISQFLLVGNKGVNPEDNAHDPKDGHIAYGSIRIDQRVRKASKKDDHMTTWDEWFDVQNGADLRGLEKYDKKRDSKGEEKPEYRFTTTT